MYNKKLKPTFNYDIEECNQLLKLGVHPIGCGIGHKDGRTYLVFMADKRYFDGLRNVRNKMKK